MAAGLPIVAADLPYARDICGDGAIYFDPHDPGSLQVALLRFRELWEAGWTPDWSARLTRFPSSWAEHAQALLSGFAAAAPAAGAARG
jgi:glycosyltransferase involved in cell wall biosynthesis